MSRHNGLCWWKIQPTAFHLASHHPVLETDHVTAPHDSKAEQSEGWWHTFPTLDSDSERLNLLLILSITFSISLSSRLIRPTPYPFISTQFSTPTPHIHVYSQKIYSWNKEWKEVGRDSSMHWKQTRIRSTGIPETQFRDYFQPSSEALHLENKGEPDKSQDTFVLFTPFEHLCTIIGENKKTRKTNSLMRLFQWECWELPEAEVQFQTNMGAFRILVSAYSVRSKGLKEYIPPMVHHLLSGDIEIKYLHVLGIGCSYADLVFALQTLCHTFRNYSLMNSSD